ncbi:transmembrane ascorbate-dependent reductase CYB561-like [Symsagittifera roscoffensis]|uniref:transmembrane ascorbate-dependent reductase CYB561-like n=1 Tax=Symsagittifera roscoffensis TaxID=84072 RepID=UPI00307B5F5C
MGADDDDKTIVEKVMGNKMVMIGVIAMAEVFGIIGLALLIHFSREYYGGYEWGDMKDGLLFTYHPLFMYLGMIFFFGNAIMSFRVMNMLPIPRVVAKCIHGGLHVCTMLFISLGLVAINRVKKNAWMGTNNMYSTHSYWGAVTIAIYVLQFSGGLISFLIPVLSDRIKRTFLPIHRFLGAGIFLMALITVLIGLTKMASTVGQVTGKSFSSYPEWGTVHIFTSCFIGLFVLTVMVVIINSGFKTPPKTTQEK